MFSQSSCRFNRWLPIYGDSSSATHYRDNKQHESDEDTEDDTKEPPVECKPAVVKSERLSPTCEQRVNMSVDEDATDPASAAVKELQGLHITFNLEAGSLLPLAIKFVL